MYLVFILVLLVFTPGHSFILRNGSFVTIYHEVKKPNTSSVNILQKYRKQRDTIIDSNVEDNQSRSFTKDEIGWSNINEELDMALERVWPIMVDKGYTTLLLPNLTETISVRLFIVTSGASLHLANGYISNMQSLTRVGDSFMTYNDKNRSFQFFANLNIGYMDLSYDFTLSLMGLISGGGTVGGYLKDTLVTGNFSVSGEDGDLIWDHFHVISFGEMRIALKSNTLIRQISGSILSPITQVFQDHIAYSISDTLEDQLKTLMDHVNKDDCLGLKQLVKNMLSGLTG